MEISSTAARRATGVLTGPFAPIRGGACGRVRADTPLTAHRFSRAGVRCGAPALMRCIGKRWPNVPTFHTARITAMQRRRAHSHSRYHRSKGIR